MVFYLGALRTALKTEPKLEETGGNLDGLPEELLKKMLDIPDSAW